MKTDLNRTDGDNPDPSAATDQPAETEKATDARALSRIIVTILLVLAFLGVGSAVFSWLVKTKPLPVQSDEMSLPPVVRVQPVVRGQVAQTFVGYGSARADQMATILAEVRGEVIDVPRSIKDGATVRKGQLLLRILDRQYQNLLDKAKSNMADVEAQLIRLDVEKANTEQLIEIARSEVKVTREEFERLTTLYEDNNASKKEWDFSRLAHDRSRRDLRGLQNQLELIEPRRAELIATKGVREAEFEMAVHDVERCTVSAPFDGQIDRIIVEVGDRVLDGAQLISIVATRFIEVPINLPLSIRSRVDPGNSAILTMDSLSGQSWQARLKRISPLADERSRTFTVYLEVDNEQQELPLMPGSFLTATIKGPVIDDAIAIPRGAIVGDNVYVLEGGVVKVRPVQMGVLIGDRSVITRGLSPGDQLILTNLDVLFDDAPVRLYAGGGATPEVAGGRRD